MIGQNVSVGISLLRSPSVMVAADDADLSTAVERGLRLSGSLGAVAASCLEKAVDLFYRHPPSAVVVDLGRPVRRGLSVVTALAAIDETVALCVLADESSSVDQSTWLEAGADDFIPKPFDLADLVRRVTALVHRAPIASAVTSGPITVGAIAIETSARRVRVKGVDTKVSSREFDLLTVLAERPTVAISRSELLKTVWGNHHFAADTRIVDAFVDVLRRKLDAAGAPGLLRTVRGSGVALGVAQ